MVKCGKVAGVLVDGDKAFLQAEGVTETGLGISEITMPKNKRESNLEARRGSGFCWLLKAGAEWKLALPLEFEFPCC